MLAIEQHRHAAGEQLPIGLRLDAAHLIGVGDHCDLYAAAVCVDQRGSDAAVRERVRLDENLRAGAVDRVDQQAGGIAPGAEGILDRRPDRRRGVVGFATAMGERRR